MLNRETRYWQQFMHILYTYHTNMGGLRRLHSHIRLQTHQNGLKRIYCPCWPLVLKNIHFLWKQKSLNQLYRILVRFLPASYSTNTPLILQSDSQMTAEKKLAKYHTVFGWRLNSVQLSQPEVAHSNTLYSRQNSTCRDYNTVCQPCSMVSTLQYPHMPHCSVIMELKRLAI